jgi:signal transduction histidine kinase
MPLLREGVALGGIVIRRTRVQAFTAKQVALLKTFADQAAIAIENVRLFEELQSRNRDLTEALARQTATSEVLKVISRSTFDLQPVLDSLVENAVRLCSASTGLIWRFDGEVFRLTADRGLSVEARDFWTRNPHHPGRGSVTGRTALERRPIHIPDVLTDPEYRLAEGQRIGGYRTLLGVPMLREGVLIGCFSLERTEAQPFTDKQIELVTTFADQAVIAIENVRLFTELQARNLELSEALDQQTATSDILRVISGSPTDLQPVMEALVASAAVLCEAQNAQIFRAEDRVMRLVARHGPVRATLEAGQARQITRGSVSGRTIVDRVMLHIPDLLAEVDAEYPDIAPAIKREGIRTTIGVPLMREGVPIGSITAFRTELRPFTDKQITLLQTFADQAVIAIENVRLFKELQARTADLTRSVDRLTALSEVGRAVSSTLDLETVLQTIVSRAVQLTGTDGGSIYEYDGAAEEFEIRATRTAAEEIVEAQRFLRLRRGEGVVGQLANTKQPVQVPDITVEGAYSSRMRDTLIRAGVHSLLAVPLLRDDELIGALVVTRRQAGAFAAETTELLRTFATQSALAIQNARLFHEIKMKSRQLETASQHKSEFLANMSHELRTPLNAIIGFSEVLGERMFGELNEKQEEYLKDIHASGQHLLSLINDILDLSKIEAGRMELELADFDLPTAIENALILIRERAGRRGITLHHAVDQQLNAIRGDERKIKQVLLNLLSNALKFTPEGGRIDVRAGLVDGMAEISVTDTGVGIAPEDQEAIFEEFRQVGTADKKVEGTGLGLALSRKFIGLHGGRIWVQSQVGAGSTFTFTISVLCGD